MSAISCVWGGGWAAPWAGVGGGCKWGSARRQREKAGKLEINRTCKQPKHPLRAHQGSTNNPGTTGPKHARPKALTEAGAG